MSNVHENSPLTPQFPLSAKDVMFTVSAHLVPAAFGGGKKKSQMNSLHVTDKQQSQHIADEHNGTLIIVQCVESKGELEKKAS